MEIMPHDVIRAVTEGMVTGKTEDVIKGRDRGRDQGPRPRRDWGGTDQVGNGGLQRRAPAVAALRAAGRGRGQMRA